MAEGQSFSLRIEGMHCGACVRRVTQALQSIAGVGVEEVRIGAARITAAAPQHAEAAIAAISKLGFTAHLEQ